MIRIWVKKKKLIWFSTLSNITQSSSTHLKAGWPNLLSVIGAGGRGGGKLHSERNLELWYLKIPPEQSVLLLREHEKTE